MSEPSVQNPAPNPRIFETHLPVRNLDRAMQFYEETIGLQRGHVDEERRIALYFAGGWGHTMLGLWEKPREKVHHQHIAFEVPLEKLFDAIGYLRESGIETKNFFGEATENPTVLAWMPSVSIYFDDPDGHLLEYLAMLPGKPRPDLGIFPWEARFANGL